MVRSEVMQLVALGPFPKEESADVDRVTEYQRLLESIALPATDEEARLLVKLFGSEGSFFGLAWSVVQLVESAPHWPLEDCLGDDQNYWIRLLKISLSNAGRPSASMAIKNTVDSETLARLRGKGD